MRDSWSLEQRRDWALERLADLDRSLTGAEARVETAREMGGGIPGFGGSGNQRAARQVRDASLSAYRNYAKVADRVDHYKSKLRYYERQIAERDRPRLAHEDVKGAKAVRTATGWRIVVRVNKTTVSVATGYSWVDRIEFGRILEVR